MEWKETGSFICTALIESQLSDVFRCFQKKRTKKLKEKEKQSFMHELGLLVK